MKKAILLLTIVILGLNITAQVKTKEELFFDSIQQVKQNCVGRQLSSFNAETLKGIKISNFILTGKVTFVNFWFESCSPCVSEMPYLDSLYKKYKKNKKFQMLSFSKDNSVIAKKAVNRFKIRYTVLSISDSLSQELNCSHGFPTNLIVDENGEVYYIKSGGFENMKDFENYFFNKLDILLKK